jgi:hypothetical protein
LDATIAATRLAKGKAAANPQLQQIAAGPQLQPAKQAFSGYDSQRPSPSAAPYVVQKVSALFLQNQRPLAAAQRRASTSGMSVGQSGRSQPAATRVAVPAAVPATSAGQVTEAFAINWGIQLSASKTAENLELQQRVIRLETENGQLKQEKVKLTAEVEHASTELEKQVNSTDELQQTIDDMDFIITGFRRNNMWNKLLYRTAEKASQVRHVLYNEQLQKIIKDIAQDTSDDMQMVTDTGIDFKLTDKYNGNSYDMEWLYKNYKARIDGRKVDLWQDDGQYGKEPASPEPEDSGDIPFPNMMNSGKQ